MSTLRERREALVREHMESENRHEFDVTLRTFAHPRYEIVPTGEIQQFLVQQGFEAEKTWRGKGCDRCRRTGYAGRLGIYELLIMDDTLNFALYIPLVLGGTCRLCPVLVIDYAAP